ncbi:uncharacterized protein LOC144037170 [Vanacampus margaritifer]
MKTSACALLALLLVAAYLREVQCSLPMEVGHAHGTVPGPHLDDMRSGAATSQRSDLRRLPGLCRRLRRRRLSYLCHKRNFCWWGRSHGWGQSGQTCRCPRGSTCRRVFIRSI